MGRVRGTKSGESSVLPPRVHHAAKRIRAYAVSRIIAALSFHWGRRSRPLEAVSCCSTSGPRLHDRQDRHGSHLLVDAVNNAVRATPSAVPIVERFVQRFPDAPRLVE